MATKRGEWRRSGVNGDEAGVCIAKAGDEMTVSDGDEVGVYAANNAGAGTTAEQFAHTWAALWGEQECKPCWAY